MEGSLSSLVLTAIFILIASVAIVPLFHRRQHLIVSIIFPVFSAASLFSLFAGILAVAGGEAETLILPVGLPDLPFHLRLDPLSGFFITVVSLLAFCVSIYSRGYIAGFIGKRSVTHLAIFYPLFLAGMLLVLVSDDAYFFLISWELMAAASYFLVLYEDGVVENRRAAYIYLVVAHIGAVAILLAFGVMAGFAAGFDTFHGYTFDAMRGASLPPAWASTAFVLAFLGFGAKAGIVPLHVWLPEAHPAAPSNVSALMSGAMLKTAIYGIVRFTFDILHTPQLWWGELVLAVGLASAILGVLAALLENDLKRLLAYSSVENIGIILVGLGLGMIFLSFHQPLMAALAITAALYHTLNHAMFKGLLFMGAGAVLHATGVRNMEKMGGLIHKMKWTAPLFLVGCLSISALPPFNGFVSEWLTFQAFLMSPSLPSQHLNLVIPLGAALLALVAALSASCFVKAFGVTFLGHCRSEACATAHDATPSMRAGMMIAATACLLLGVFPTVVIAWMGNLSSQLAGETIARSAGEVGWLWLTPVSAQRASYAAPMVLLGIASVLLVVFLTLRSKKSAIHRVPLWDCGFEKITSTMQYTSTAFSMPPRLIFGYLFHIKERVRPGLPDGRPAEFPAKVNYSVRVRDRAWGWFYRPVADLAFRLAKHTARLQHGRIHIYLAYSFFTILFLLLVAL
ncbi:MAG: hydrogenase 4 subunit B [Nitrospinae bacterium]|nr:hydrogenase 4 subunit B [Nitrospinota bacterium]